MQSQVPQNVLSLIDKLAATADRLGSYVALSNINTQRDPRGSSLYHEKAEASQRELDKVKLELQKAIESYGSQLYEGGLDLGRAEGAR